MQIKYYLDWYINDKDASPLLAGLKSLSMSSSILSLYPVASMVIQLPASLIESGELSVGAKITLDFYKDNGNTVRREYKIWKIAMNSLDSARSLSGVYTITLIHPWFFSQVNISKAYYGNTFLVLNQIMFEEHYKDFNNISIDISKDLIAKHFRTYQTSGSFIETRIMDKYYVDNSPTFIYVSDQNNFHAHSFKSTLIKDFGNKLIDTRRISEVAKTLQDSADKDRLLQPTNISYSLNASGNIWNMFLNKSTFLYTTHDVKAPVSLASEDASYFSSGFFPISASIKNIKNPLSVYIDDSESNSFNSYSKFLYKQRDLILDQIFSFACTANLTIEVGEPISLSLKQLEDKDMKSSDTDSIFSSNYLIVSLEHTYRNSIMTTTATIAKDAVTPLNVPIAKTSSGFLS